MPLIMILLLILCGYLGVIAAKAARIHPIIGFIVGFALNIPGIVILAILAFIRR